MGELCGIEWDDRDDPAIPLGQGFWCTLPADHEGNEHECRGFRWTK